MFMTKRTAQALIWMASGVLALVFTVTTISVRAGEPPSPERKEPVPKKDAEVQPIPFPWKESLKIALAETKKKAEKKEGSGLVLVVVVRGQCRYCDQLDEKLFFSKKVIEVAKQVPFVREKVGGDETGVFHDSTFAKEQKTPFTPSFYILDGSGKIIDKNFGLPTPDELVAWLAKSEKDYQTFPELETRVKEHPDDLNALARYAAALAARGRVDDAVALVKQAEGARGEPIAALAPAYNRIGDTHYQAVFKAMCELYGSFEKYEKGCPEAVRWFKKTIETSKDPEHLAYAHFGLAFCVGSEGKSEEKAAILKEILALPNAPELLKKRVKMILKVDE
jgi:thioredoxin-related protein